MADDTTRIYHYGADFLPTFLSSPPIKWRIIVIVTAISEYSCCLIVSLKIPFRTLPPRTAWTLFMFPNLQPIAYASTLLVETFRVDDWFDWFIRWLMMINSFFREMLYWNVIWFHPPHWFGSARRDQKFNPNTTHYSLTPAYSTHSFVRKQINARVRWGTV